MSKFLQGPIVPKRPFLWDTVPMSRRSRSDNPAYLLRLISEGADTWSSICDHLGLGSPTGTKANVLTQVVTGLAVAGLVNIKKYPKGSKKIETITVSEKWLQIQGLLKISLRDLSKMTAGDSIIVKPYFDRPKAPKNPNDLFVVMPFKPQLKAVYTNHITRVARDLNLTFARGDDFFTARSVMHDIWDAIAASRIVIADCTGRNPNVFYEIGIAHTIGVPVILIAQNAKDVPFDIRHLRYIPYSLTPQGKKAFEKTLRKTLITALRLPDQ